MRKRANKAVQLAMPLQIDINNPAESVVNDMRPASATGEANLPLKFTIAIDGSVRSKGPL